MLAFRFSPSGYQEGSRAVLRIHCWIRTEGNQDGDGRHCQGFAQRCSCQEAKIQGSAILPYHKQLAKDHRKHALSFSSHIHLAASS